MSAIIVYYSLEGNSDYAAQKIASRIEADTLRLEPEKEYPKGGLKKFIYGGKSAVMSETPKLMPYEFNADAYDWIIFGFPVWASNIAPPLRTFIKENNLKGKHFAAFACMSGGGADKAFIKLEKALGIDSLEEELVLIDPKTRPSSKNAIGIEDFCDELMVKM
jgi:flavodoxin